ncbi:MAG TPA: trypsin-like peptidase domain-containing protein [Candidatus Dormibacteraeota bacterium]|nr:trypsin-like peptidase domain-containing protein [Candidatus Dormibacteraeota bacterium]
MVAAIAATGSGIGVGWGLARALRTPTAATSPVTASPAQVPAQPQAPIQPVAPRTGSLDAQAIAAKVDPAVVDINTVTGLGNAAGTGMILTSTGEVLTNNHVVDQSTSISVTIAGRPGSYAATVIGVDPTSDVALIQIQGVSGLPTVTLASSSSLQVGQPIVAIGNALGAGGTPSVTQGAITALDQSITASEGGAKSEQLTGMIQADAPIQPGDSGGPLVNSAGQVIGMITAGEAQGFRSQVSTTDYAIPSDEALRVVNLIRSGSASSEIIRTQQSYLGVQVRTLDQAHATQLGLSVSTGALVVSVQPGSAAERAGITRDSVITAVGGTPVTDSASLGPALHAFPAGGHAPITYVDQGGTHTISVTLGAVNA